jgi:cytochrome c oxidase assembly protein subunit 15
VLSEDQLGILHGCLAQLLFVSVSLIGLFTSRWWIEGRSDFTPPKWSGRTLAITALIFCQLMLGATMRHQHAGLAIHDFPLAYGQVWPNTDPTSVEHYNTERLKHHTLLGATEPLTTALAINLQMAHRVGAVLITVAILATAAGMWLTPGSAPILRRWSAVWVGLVFVQFALGAFTIWTNKAADVATTHVAVGALTFVLGTLLTAMSWRLQSRLKIAAATPSRNPTGRPRSFPRLRPFRADQGAPDRHGLADHPGRILPCQPWRISLDETHPHVDRYRSGRRLLLYS